MSVIAPPSPERARGPEAVSIARGATEIEDVFERARGGSVDDWAELYALARPQLFRFARLRLASDEQAEDAVSETMARAIAAAGRYRVGAGPVPWLVGICRNVVRETYRSGSRLRAVDPARFVDQAAVAPESGPAELAVLGDEAEALRRAFARLGADERELLALRVVVGLDAASVADVVGKRAGAVRMAQSRALDRLRTLLEEV